MATYEAQTSEGRRYAEFNRIDPGMNAEGLFISDDGEMGRSGGHSGATGVAGDWDALPLNALGDYDFFEYRVQNGGPDDFDYFRVYLKDLPSLSETAFMIEDPSPLTVRHRHWPGTDRREMQAQIQQRVQRQIQQTLKRAQSRRDAQLRKAEREAREAQMMDEVRAEYEANHMSIEDQIREAMVSAGFSPEEIAQAL